MGFEIFSAIITVCGSSSHLSTNKLFVPFLVINISDSLFFLGRYRIGNL
jgi:hypothetical protein